MSKKYRVGCKELDENGRGKVRFNNRDFAVPNLLPGEKGEIELVFSAKETKARLVSLDEKERSKDRVNPPCKVYEKCGGCQLMHMSYEAQLKWKQKLVEDLFPEETKAGKVLPMIKMKNPLRYRHKVFATFSRGERGRIIAGIYEEDSHRVVSTSDCLIQNEKANAIITAIVDLMKGTKTLPYDEDRQTGILRHAYIRIAENTNQIMVVLVTGNREFWEANRFAKELMKKFPEIKTVVHNFNNKKTSAVLGKKEWVISGPGYIEDTLCGLTFRISPQSFYQVNPVQTEILYRIAVEFAAIGKEDIVLDTYCGIGTISLVASGRAKQVIGVELNPQAVYDAKINAKQNHCDNVSFIHKDASEYMKQLAQDVKEKKSTAVPDVVFMDPPRSGSTDDFLNALAALTPKKIVYISCNPQTQKRDIDVLKRKGYQIVRIQAVDCFCHTAHVESVVLMARE